MDFEGKSVLDVREDPRTAINTAAILALQTQQTALLQFCRIEAVPVLPVSTLQESNPVSQFVTLTGNNPDLYNQGYVQAGENDLVLKIRESLYMKYYSNDSIRWTRSYQGVLNQTVIALHVKGMACFELLDFATVLGLAVRKSNAQGQVYATDYVNLVRFGTRNNAAGDIVGVYNIDTVLTFVLDPYAFANLWSVDFKVVVLENFGTTPSFTSTLTGGWKENYRNYLQVQQIQ